MPRLSRIQKWIVAVLGGIVILFFACICGTIALEPGSPRGVIGQAEQLDPAMQQTLTVIAQPSRSFLKVEPTGTAVPTEVPPTGEPTETPLTVLSEPTATATIFYVVVTDVPTKAPPTLKRAPTRAPATKVPATTVPPTAAPVILPTSAPAQTSGRYVASSQARTNYYCVTDPAWKKLKAALIWSDDESVFQKMGLVLHRPC